MLCVWRFVIMNRSATYRTRRTDCFEPCTMFASQVPVLRSRITPYGHIGTGLSLTQRSISRYSKRPTSLTWASYTWTTNLLRKER
jgi:hypothetical protein